MNNWSCAVSFQAAILLLPLFTLRKGSQDLLSYTTRRGATQKDHPLNRMGGGNILIWKRRSERYLIQSGLHYTIIRAGGLLDSPGGQRKLLVSSDDAFLTATSDGSPAAVPRADVAAVVVQALLLPEARDLAFDLINRPQDISKTTVTQDFAALFARTSSGH